MGSNQITYNLRFNADTSQAQAQIQQLQTALTKISLESSKGGMEKGMSKAASAAQELSYHLNQAYNATTGNLDLSKLNKSLNASGTNVTKLSTSLLEAGNTGQQAFIKLAESIAAAERPAISLNSKFTDMLTTLKNTAKWELSSKIMHGFESAISSAYGYAQDLNESLNSIRIVTGASIDDMAAFAEQANKAAKALSTTTTEYTNASLIFYQQGLSDSEVQARTDITIKMANAAGESAETVSDQLTAVWNNFYDGSKSLEYYADVMTKLGAATASSTDEIATGLEKFAAVAETVGLSYEYATAALATVTDKTRQSADVVGTAFKTIFSRLEGLELGDTLEDGTTLNEYSAALAVVGVNIKDANGELKDMDVILDEMAEVWDQLNRDEQVALAQKVAGVRQYNQLISLMENWDFMEENIATATNSSGSLQEQADIYAESWEAARDRVTASWEQIYSDLIDDEFFINLANGFSSFLDSIDAFIDSFGGVKMIITSVGSLLLSIFASKVPDAVNNLRANFSVLFHGAQAEAQKVAKEMATLSQNLIDSNELSASSETALKNATAMNIAKNKLSSVQDKLTAQEKQQYSQQISVLSLLQDETKELSVQVTKRQEALEALREEVSYGAGNVRGDREKEEERLVDEKNKAQKSGDSESIAAAKQELREYREATEEMGNAQDSLISKLMSSYEEMLRQKKSLSDVKGETVNVSEAFGGYTEKLQKLGEAIKYGSSKNGKDTYDVKLKEIKEALLSITDGNLPEEVSAALEDALSYKKGKGVSYAEATEEMKAKISKLVEALENAQYPAEETKHILEELGQKSNVGKLEKQIRSLTTEEEKLRKKQEQINKLVNEFNPSHTVGGIEKITSAAAGMGQLVSTVQSARALFEAWNNDDLTFGEKLMTSFTSISALVPSVISSVKSLNTAFSVMEGVQTGLALAQQTVIGQEYKKIAAMEAEQLAKEKNISLEQAAILITQASVLSKQADIKSIMDQMKAEGGLTAEQAAQEIVKLTGITTEQAAVVVKELSAGKTLQQALAEAGLTVAKKGGIVATIAQTVAQWAYNAAASVGLSVTLAFVAAIGSVAVVAALAIAGIYGLVKIVQGLIDAYNADSIAAERASEAAAALGAAYDEAAQKYQDMIDTMSQYEEALESLEGLTKGTQEYIDKLNEANEAALTLINLMGLTKGEGYDIEDGVITIHKDSEQYQNAQGEVAAEKQSAYNAKIMAEATDKIASAQEKQTELVRENDKSVIKSKMAQGANYGMGVGAAVGGGIGTATGQIYLEPLAAAAGALGGALGGLIDGVKQNASDNKAEQARIDKLTEAYQKQGSVVFEDSNLQDLGFGNLTEEYKKALKKQVEANSSALESLGVAAELCASQILSLKSSYENSEAKDDIEGAGTKVYENAYQKKYNEYMGVEVANFFGKGTSEFKEIWDKYEQTVLGDLKNVKVENFKTDGTVDYSYVKTNEDGTTETKTTTVTAEEIAAKLATYYADSFLYNSADNLVGLFENLQTSDRGSALSALISSDNLNGATYGELTSFSWGESGRAHAEGVLKRDPEYWKEAGYDSAEAYLEAMSSAISSESLSTFISNKFSTDDLQALGYESAEELANAFKEQYDVAMENWNGLEAFQDYSLEEAKKLKDIFSQTGEQSNNFDESELANYYDGLSDEEKEIFLELNFDKDATIENFEEAVAEVKDQKIEVLIKTKAAEEAEKYDLDADQVEEVAKAYKDLYKEMGDGTESIEEQATAATAAATRFLRLNNAVIDLNDNYDDYSDLLSQVRNESDKVNKAMLTSSETGKKLKKSLSDLLNVNEDLISTDLLETIDPADFQKAANGDEAAIQRIQDAFIKLQAEANGVDFSGLKNELNSLKEGETITLGLDNSQYLTALVESQLAAGASWESIQSTLSGLGLDVDITPLEGTLEDAKQAALKAGGAVAESLSYSADTTQEVNETEVNGTEAGYTETISWTPNEKESTVLETNGLFSTPQLTGKKEIVYTASKTVTPENTPTSHTETTTTTTQNVTTGSGEGGTDKKGTYHIITARRSAGSSVAPSTTANINKGKGSGGSSGGSGSSSTPATKTKAPKKSDTVERYKEITDLIEDNARALEAANKQADRLWGAAKLKAMDEVNAKLEKENKLLAQQKKEVQANLNTDKSDLEAAAKDMGYTVKFDEEGRIDNYDAIMTAAWKKQKAMYDHMNSLSTKEEQDEYKEKNIDPWEEKIEGLQEYMDQYDESRNLMMDIDEQMVDNLNTIADNKLSKLVYKVELKLEIDDTQLKALEFQLKQLEDKDFSSAERINIIQDQYTATRQKVVDARQGASSILAQAGMTKEQRNQFFAGEEVTGFDWSIMTEGQMSQLKEYMETASEGTEELMDLMAEAREEALAAFDEWSEALEEQIAQFDHYDAVLDHYLTIIDLAGQKRLDITKKQIKAYNNLKVENATAKLETSKSFYDETADKKKNAEAQLAAAQKRYNNYEKKDDEVGMEAAANDITYWEDYIEEVDKKLQEAQESYLADWEAALQASQDAFLANAEQEIAELEKQMAGAYETISAMQEDFDRTSTINDRYLDDYERIYELNKLNRDLTAKMDETTNIKAKKELAKLQEEILSYQEEGRLMSEYDLEYLQKKYDLRVAEIAMEEAQNAKSQVRLTRDAEGNYSYTYTADEDSMADAQQTYEDKLYEITNLSNEYIEEQTSQLLATQQAYTDALEEIAEKASQGLYATTEEYYQALNETNEYYSTMLKYYGSEIDKATIDNAVIYATDYSTYSGYVDDKLSESERLQREMDAQIIATQGQHNRLSIEYQAAQDEVARKYVKDTDEYKAAMETIETTYQGEIDRLDQEAKALTTERIKKYGEDADAYDIKAKARQASEEGFVTSFDTLLPKLQGKYTTASGYVDDMEDAMDTYLGTAEGDFKDFQTQTDKIMEAAGTSVEDFSKDTDKVLTDEDNENSLKNQIKDTKDSFEELAETVGAALDTAMTSLTAFQKQYSKSLQNLINKNTQFLDGYTKVLEAEVDEAEAEGKKKDSGSGSGNSGSGSGSGNSGSGSGSGSNGETNYNTTAYHKGVAAAIWWLGSDKSGWGTGTTRQSRVNTKLGSGAYDKVRTYLNSADKGDKTLYNFTETKAKKYVYSKFDTGGYTGKWGPDGKFALLHEKELVLNKDDTENMLKIVSMVRDLSNALDSQAYYSSLAKLEAEKLGSISSTSGDFEQNVTITAEFPNATSAGEIEAALNNLINSASQYANKK